MLAAAITIFPSSGAVAERVNPFMQPASSATELDNSFAEQESSFAEQESTYIEQESYNEYCNWYYC